MIWALLELLELVCLMGAILKTLWPFSQYSGERLYWRLNGFLLVFLLALLWIFHGGLNQSLTIFLAVFLSGWLIVHMILRGVIIDEKRSRDGN